MKTTKAYKEEAPKNNPVKEGKKRMGLVNSDGKGLEEGSAEEEAGESPQEEAAEQAAGEGDAEGVTVRPEFQSALHNLMKDASKHELKHARDHIYDREDKMRKEEMAKERKEQAKTSKDVPGGDSVPATMSTEGMPVD